MRVTSPAAALVAALAMTLASSLAAPAALAQAPTVAANCPGQPKLPLTFEIDCSHVADPAARNLCKAFIENQACKIFPAYREITGIKLTVTGVVPGITAEQFQAAAEDARKNCPVSKVITGTTITLEATLAE